MSFLKHIEETRQRARQTMEDGTVTQDYQLDRAQAVRVLNLRCGKVDIESLECLKPTRPCLMEQRQNNFPIYIH